jgi:hypothetical protein
LTVPVVLDPAAFRRHELLAAAERRGLHVGRTTTELGDNQYIDLDVSCRAPRSTPSSFRYESPIGRAQVLVHHEGAWNRTRSMGNIALWVEFA